MHSYDVIGYADCGGEVYCPDHEPEQSEQDRPEGYESCDASPIFADSEWDNIPACGVCGEPLDVRLTEEGIRYTLEALTGEWHGKPEHREEWVRILGDHGVSVPDTIPCASCGMLVYDDEDNAHVHSGLIPCDDEMGEDGPGAEGPEPLLAAVDRPHVAAGLCRSCRYGLIALTREPCCGCMTGERYVEALSVRYPDRD